MALTRERLTDYLRRRVGVATLDDEAPLFSEGLVDSVGMVDLIAFIEVEAGCEIHQDEVSLANFDTISRIMALVGRRSADSDRVGPRAE